MKNKIKLFLASSLLTVAANAQTSQIDLQAPSSVNQVAEVYVVMSPKFFQNKIARFEQMKATNTLESTEYLGNSLVFQRCEAQECSTVSADITGQSSQINLVVQ